MFVYLLKRLPCAGGNPVSAGINFKDKDKDNDKYKEGLPLKNKSERPVDALAVKKVTH